MKFEWDKRKETANLSKHGIGFTTAETAFHDPERILMRNTGRTSSETRWLCIGYDGEGVLTFIFTLRKGVVRVISAGYWRKGKKLYEK